MRAMQIYSPPIKIPGFVRCGLEYAITVGLALLSSYWIVYGRW